LDSRLRVGIGYSVASGILVILFAAWALMTDRDFINWWHDRWHHPVA